MRKPRDHKTDRLPVQRKNSSTPEARQRVIDGLVVSATTDFVSLVRWLKSGKTAGEAIPFDRCKSLRDSIAHLQTLDAGVQTEWKQALQLMEDAIKKRHQLKDEAPAPSQIVTGVLSNLNDISEKIAAGQVKPEMLGRLETMLQLISSLKGSDDLTKSISIVIESAHSALRGNKKQSTKPKVRKSEKPDPAVRDEQAFRAECAPIIGVSDIVIIASCLISMSARLGQSPVNLAKRAVALKGGIKPELLPELLELLQQDIELSALSPIPKVKDDNTRSDGGKLVGLTGIVEGGVSIGVETQRIITAELKKIAKIPGAQRLFLDNARFGLASESDPFKVIDEVKRIAEKHHWSPLSVAAYAAHKTPGIRPDIAGDVISLLAQDEALSPTTVKR